MSAVVDVYEAGDDVFTMSRTGKVVCWEVQEDGTLRVKA